MTPLSQLSIAALRRPGKNLGDGAFTTERHFWDFVIGGTSLRATLQHLDDGQHLEKIGVLGWGPAELEGESVAKLQGEAQPDYPPNRVAIYVCPECGDLGCGAMTVAVGREEGAITWTDFRWEVNWYADYPSEATVHYELGPFRFAADAYTEVLNRALLLRPKAG